MKILVRFLKDESGATVIDYGLIAAGIALATISVVNGVGFKLKTNFGRRPEAAHKVSISIVLPDPAAIVILWGDCAADNGGPDPASAKSKMRSEARPWAKARTRRRRWKSSGCQRSGATSVTTAAAESFE